MARIGKCCCAACEACTEQSGLTTWSIAESFLGLSFSGTFTALNETNCTKFSCVCERLDNVEIDGEATIASDWTAYVPFLQCGTCSDCTDPNDPINIMPCAVDPFTGTCDPSYPKYVIWDSSSRNGVRVKFYYSVGADFCLTVHYLSGNRIYFEVQTGFTIASLAESAFALQRRYRRRDFFCNTTTAITTTVYNDGALTVPEPLAPCEDPLTEWLLDCDTYTPPTPPDPCESATTTTVTESGCELIVGGICTNVSDSATVTTGTEVNCCDGNNSGCEPTFGLQQNVVFYISEIYDCDSVPATIELTLDTPDAATEYTLDWECEPGWTNNADTTVFTLPLTLTLTVA